MPTDRAKPLPPSDERVTEVFELIRRVRDDDREFAKLVEWARQLADPGLPESPQPNWDHPLTIDYLKLGPGTTRATLG